MAKLNEEQQHLIETYLQSFTSAELISDILGYDTFEEFKADVEETYYYSIEKLARINTAIGLAEYRKDLVILARDKPSATVLLYKDLEARGMIGVIAEDETIDGVEIEIIGGNEDEEEV